MFWQSRNDSKWFKIYVFEKRIMADEPPHLMAKVSDFSIFLVPPYSDKVKGQKVKNVRNLQLGDNPPKCQRCPKNVRKLKPSCERGD